MSFIMRQLRIMSISKNLPLYITVRQFADILGISHQAVYKRIKNKKLKSKRYGHNHLINRKQLALFYKTSRGVLKREKARIINRTLEGNNNHK